MASLFVDIVMNTVKAVTGFNQVGAAAKKTGGAVTTFGSKSKTAFSGVATSLTKTALGGLGATAAITAVGAALVDASKSAMEDERSQALLRNTMENTLDATDDQIAAMEDWIDKTARATGVTDNELRPALQTLMTVGMNASEAQRNLNLAMDIATSRGLDLQTVTKALAKAYDGNVGALGRVGVSVRDADGDMQSFEEITAKAAETMGGAMAVAASTLEGKMKRATVAVDEAKESVGGWVNVQLADAITGVTFLNSSMDQANKGNELFAQGIVGVRGALDDQNDSVAALAGGLVFAANHAVAPTTEALLEQATQLGLTEGETRLLSEKINELAADNELGRSTANEFMGALDDQAAAMASTREDGRLLSDRYLLLRDDAEEARVKAAGYRRELQLQADEMRKLIDPVFALRDAQRDYNAAFETWSTLMIDSKTPADELAAAEDDLAEAGLDLAAAEREAARGGHAAKDAFNASRTAVGLLEDATWGSKEAIDQWSSAVNNSPRWHPGGVGGGVAPRAMGGPFFGGQALLVGERGPEVILPNRSGTVIPNHMLRGGGVGSSYTLNITTRKADANDVAHGFRRLELLRG